MAFQSLLQLRILSVVLLCLLLAHPGSAALGVPGQNRGPRASLDVEGINVKAVLYSLQDLTKIRIELGPGIQGLVSLTLRDTPLEDLFDKILPSLGLRWEKQGSHYLVTCLSDPTARTDVVKMQRGFDSLGLSATYYSDTFSELPNGFLSSLPAVPPAGTKVWYRKDAVLHFEWNSKKSLIPGFPLTHWSARWRGRLWVPTEDSYTFALDRAAGAALFMIDQRVIINGWRRDPTRTLENSCALTRGWHEVEIQYHQGITPGGLLKLSWSVPGLPKEVIPTITSVKKTKEGKVIR